MTHWAGPADEKMSAANCCRWVLFSSDMTATVCGHRVHFKPLPTFHYYYYTIASHGWWWFLYFSPQKFRCGMSWNFGCYFGNSPIARDDSMYSTTSLYKNDRRSSPLYVVRLFMTKRNLPWSMMCVDLHTQVEATDDKTKFASFDSYISNPQLNGWTSHTHIHLNSRI
jgi:hypothetical protein